MRRGRKAKWKFSARDRQNLQAALRSVREVPAFRRVQTVLLVAEGHTITETALLTHQSRQSVHAALERYFSRHRIEDLRDAPRSGRPRVSDCLSDACLTREFNRDPMALGYRATEWTVPLLACHLEKTTGCAISHATLRRRMRAIGLVWKRPRHSFSEKAPHLPQKKGPLRAA